MGEAFHLNFILCEFMERLSKATASSLFNLVPRQLGEELLQLERDIRRKYEEQVQAKAAQKGESEEVLGEEDDDNKVEMVDLLDDIDVKEEKVEELEIEMVVDLELNGGEVGGEGDIGGECGKGGEDVEVGGEDGMTVKVLVEGDSENWAPMKESKREGAIKHESRSSKRKSKNAKQPKKCDICEKMCSRKSELERHKAVHSKVYLSPSKKNFLPWYTFGSYSKFEKSSRGLYICPSCKQEYKKDVIRRHLKYMHVNSKGPGYPKFKCDQCGKEVCELKKHIEQRHNKKKPFKCDVCAFDCSTRSQVRIHKKMKHDGVKDTCHMCGAVVTNLSSHIRSVHNKDKYKFACDLCGKTFGLIRDLSRHKGAMHSGRVKRGNSLCSQCSHCNIRCKILNMPKHLLTIHGISNQFESTEGSDLSRKAL